MSTVVVKEKKLKSKGMPVDLSEKVITVIAYIFVTLLTLIALLPCLHVISKAFSNGSAVISGKVYFWPVGIQLETISKVVTKTNLLRSIKNSLFVTVVGVTASMLTSILFAYPLSKTDLKGRKFFIVICIISMVFNGGMVPKYIVMKTLGLLDSYLALILPHALSIFNMLIIKNYFEGLPESTMESAAIDGANDVITLFKIVCPMALPVIATVSLLYAVSYWNIYFSAVLYIKSSSMKVLQVFLKDLISSALSVSDSLITDPNVYSHISPDGVVACATVLAIIPIVALYPFIQRYMIKGITIGSEKG
ncbi:MAG TPA: carbohydrate ABC transporter permease [Thermoclostridium sp.]